MVEEDVQNGASSFCYATVLNPPFNIFLCPAFQEELLSLLTYLQI